MLGVWRMEGFLLCHGGKNIPASHPESLCLESTADFLQRSLDSVVANIYLTMCALMEKVSRSIVWAANSIVWAWKYSPDLGSVTYCLGIVPTSWPMPLLSVQGHLLLTS